MCQDCLNKRVGFDLMMDGGTVEDGEMSSDIDVVSFDDSLREAERELFSRLNDPEGHDKITGSALYPPDSLINVSCEVDTELHELSRLEDEGNPNTREC